MDNEEQRTTTGNECAHLDCVRVAVAVAALARRRAERNPRLDRFRLAGHVAQVDLGVGEQVLAPAARDVLDPIAHACVHCNNNNNNNRRVNRPLDRVTRRSNEALPVPRGWASHCARTSAAQAGPKGTGRLRRAAERLGFLERRKRKARRDGAINKVVASMPRWLEASMAGDLGGLRPRDLEDQMAPDRAQQSALLDDFCERPSPARPLFNANFIKSG